MSPSSHRSSPQKTRRVLNRIGTSCEPCHRRKVKCDQSQPCGQCVRNSLQHECRFRKRASAVRSPLVPDAALRTRTTHTDRPHASPQSRDPPTSALVHRWTGVEDVRGRSHHSWLIKKFEPLLSQCLMGTCAAGPWPDTRAYSECASTAALQIESQQDRSTMAPVLYDELPDPQTTEWLIERFFATLGTTFSILHPPTFHDTYARMRENRGGASVCFMVQLLLVLCLANATLPDSSQPIPRDKITAWINLAEGLPQTAMHLRTFNVESVRMWALICLAEQMWHSDEFADYVYSGAALRAGAALGLHHSRLWDSSGQRQGLWEALVELDLQACLAAGMPPSLSYFNSQPTVPAGNASRSPSPSSERSTSQTLSPDRPTDPELSGSLQCRHRIVQALNCTTDLTLESALDLGRQLTASMLPLLETQSGSTEPQSFQQQFLAHVYAKFLAALHRPFAMMESPAFYYSRTVALSLAQKNAAEMFALYTGEPDKASAFDCLRLGGGSFCKAHSISAFLLLCWTLQHPDRPDNRDPVMSWIEPGLEMNGRSATIYSTVNKLLPFVKSHPRDQDMAARTHLIGFLTIAHYEISGECAIGSDEFLRRMRESASTWHQ